MLLHDAINAGEPHAGALTKFVRREKRFEYPAAGRFIHAMAGVGNAEPDKISLAGFRILRRARL